MSSKTYDFAFRSAARRSAVRLAVQQGRLYVLAAEYAPTAAVEAEVAQIVSSFKCFSVNAICISASNRGSTPLPGTCY